MQNSCDLSLFSLDRDLNCPFSLHLELLSIGKSYCSVVILVKRDKASPIYNHNVNCGEVGHVGKSDMNLKLSILNLS